MHDFELALRTQRLHLIAATGPLARAAATGHAALSEALDAIVPTEWPPPLLADHVEEFAINLEQHPEQVGLSMWYFVRDDASVGERVLIGSGGAGGVVDADGTLAIGYAVLDAFQRQGYATEAMSAIADWMFARREVERLTADTYPHLTPSIRVMEKLGMRLLGDGPEAGTIRYVRDA